MTDLMTVAEAAAYFKITPNSVHRWAARGVLQKVRVANKPYFRVSDIQALTRRPRTGRPRKQVQG